MEQEKVPTAILTLTVGFVVILVSLWVGQNHGLMPEQASEQAPVVDRFFDLMMTIGTALFLVVEGAIVLALLIYRQNRGDRTDAAPLKGNLPLEAFWTAVPAIIVIALGIYSVEVFRDMGGFEPAHHHMSAPSAQVGTASASDISAPLIADSESTANPDKVKYGFGANPTNEGTIPDVAVTVTGLQFAWIFNYPDSGITSGELHVPIGKQVQLNMTAQDVIHSFWVPQFRLKQDVMPGQQSQLNFVATKTGTYPIVCTELCGSYHGAMRAQLIVHTPEEYETWLQENRVATSDSQKIAVNPEELSDREFLAPYAGELGIDPHTIAQLNQQQL